MVGRAVYARPRGLPPAKVARRPARPTESEHPLTTTRPQLGLARLLPLGVIVGVMSGLFGIGGGVLVVVALVAAGFAQHAAHATSLAAIILTASAAVVPFARAGGVAVDAALALAFGAAMGAWVGAGVMHRIPERPLRLAFVALLLLTAARMLVGTASSAGVESPALSVMALVACLGVGVVTGGLSSVLGVGGGVVMVPALVLGLGFSQHAAEGTSLAVVVPTALIGALRHQGAGYTDWRTGLLLGVGGVAGGLLGATIALALDAAVLQRLFAVFLLVMAWRIATKGGGRRATAPTPSAEGPSEDPPRER